MKLVLKQLDNFKLTGRLSLNFACSYSPDGRIFLLSDTGVYIITLKCDLTSTFSNLSCKKEHFKPSKYALCDNVGIDIQTFIYDLPREYLYESVLRYDLSANLGTATSPEIVCLHAEWSPLGLVGKTHCMLAVLTNLHSLELYIRYIDENGYSEYFMVLNVTEEMLNVKKQNFKYSDKLPGALVKFKEFKRRVEQVAACGFAWGHMLEIDQERYCPLFVGHLDNSVSVWRIPEVDSNDKSKANAVLIGTYKTQLGPTSRFFWNQTTKYGGGLCIGDVSGKMSVISIKNLDALEAIIDNEVAFCVDEDRAVDKLTVMTFDTYTCIVMVKQNYIIFYCLNYKGEVFCHTIHDAGNLYVTGIHCQENVLFVLTFTGVLKKLTLNVTDNNLSIEEQTIPLKFDWTGYRTHGFFISQNKVVLGVFACTNKVKNSTKGKKFTQAVFYHNAALNPFTLLMRNGTDTLNDHWDCFEVLRLLCIKEQRFPWLGLDPDLNYDELSLTELKTLRCIARLSETMFTVVPKITNYNIKPFILLHYLVDIKVITRRLKKLINLKNSGKELSLFQMRSIDLQNFFLKEMVVKGILAKANVGKNFIREIKEVMSVANELEYPDMQPCHWCGEKLIGPLCVPPHADSRCAFSMMQISLIPAYKCPLCGSLAHENMKMEYGALFCPYCDVPMDVRCTETEVKSVVQEGLNEKDLFCNPYSCHSDCLHLEDAETDVSDRNSDDNNYVILSDDSDSDENLKMLYFKTAKMTIQEIVEQKDKLVSELSYRKYIETQPVLISESEKTEECNLGG